MTLRTLLITVTFAALAAQHPAQAEEAALVSYQSLSLESAQKLAQATLQACRKAGYQVAVSVVDRAGVPQVLLRDRYAGSHTPETARRKAWTAASFRTDTMSLMKETQSGHQQAGVRFISEAMMVGGGIPVMVAGSVVGAVGMRFDFNRSNSHKKQ